MVETVAMKLLFLTLSLTLGTAALVKTVELMNEATAVVAQATGQLR